MKLIFVKTFFGKRLCYSSVLILKVALFLGVQSCSKLNFSHVENIASTQTYLPPEENEGPGIERSEVVQSSVLQFFQPPEQITKQVDILFVVDTSGSLDDERNSIGKNIAEFIEALPSDTDYVISVLLAHGSKSSWSGKLYSKNNQHPVLKSKDLSLTEIQSHLKDSLSSGPGDSASDGGEEGLYSLQNLLKAPNLVEARSKGFFRDNSALAVVFISDENDICASFPAGVVPKRDSQGLEDPAKANDCVPNNITAETTYQKLIDLQSGLPLLVAGIIYTNPATVPSGDEDEVGYGYTDIISLNQGLAVDILSDIGKGLAKIGDLVTMKLNLKTSFSISNSEIVDCAFQVIPDSIEVKIDNTIVPHVFRPSICEVQIDVADAGRANSRVLISYSYLQN